MNTFENASKFLDCNQLNKEEIADSEYLENLLDIFQEDMGINLSIEKVENIIKMYQLAKL